MKVICPTCKGKGHVLNMASMAFVPVVGWALALLESNDPYGQTRERCNTCKGKGKI